MTTEVNEIVVELLIFSGRPDPEWVLEEEEIATLRDRLGSIQRDEPIDEAPSGGLGYRGFLVRNEGKLSDIPSEFIVYKNVLTEEPGPKARHWRDSSEIEEFLLATARRQGLGELLDAAGVEGKS